MSVKLGALRLMVRALEAKERGLRSAEVGVGRVVLGGGRCLGQAILEGCQCAPLVSEGVAPWIGNQQHGQLVEIFFNIRCTSLESREANHDIFFVGGTFFSKNLLGQWLNFKLFGITY